MKEKGKGVKKKININNKQLSVSSLIICFIILLFSTSIMIFTSIMKDVDSYHEDTRQYSLEVVSSIVLDAKKEIDATLSYPLKQISNSIEEDIRNTGNLEEIEIALNSGIIPEELEEIFSNNIEDVSLLNLKGTSNDIFIATKDGIICDYSIKDATDTSVDRTWEYEANCHYNKEMAKTTIENILNEDNTTILAFEKEKSNTANHIYYLELDEKTLKSILATEGIDGLKNYTFLVPIYITENGDVFGKSDIKAGHIQDTNKFIVIQEYSLYDYIKKYRNMCIYDIEILEKDHYDMIILLRIFAISLVMAVVCVVVFAAILANSLFDASIFKSELLDHYMVGDETLHDKNPNGKDI